MIQNSHASRLLQQPINGNGPPTLLQVYRTTNTLHVLIMISFNILSNLFTQFCSLLVLPVSSVKNELIFFSQNICEHVRFFIVKIAFNSHRNDLSNEVTFWIFSGESLARGGGQGGQWIPRHCIIWQTNLKVFTYLTLIENWSTNIGQLSFESVLENFELLFSLNWSIDFHEWKKKYRENNSYTLERRRMRYAARFILYCVNAGSEANSNKLNE